MQCTLCNHSTALYSQHKGRDFYLCPNCETVLLHPSFYLDAEQEKGRYDLHSDDVNSAGYQNFVKPITDAVQQDFSPYHKGLDFGCGKTEIVKYVLSQKGFNVKGYDPYYFDFPELLNQKYDYITSCEVIEHLYQPLQVFKMLYDLLEKNGKLYLKTSLFNLDLNFDNWWYKNDPTHVTLYTKKSLETLKIKLSFQKLEVTNKLIVFTK